MGREVKRVAMDFDWPLKQVWAGYFMPEAYNGQKCPDCRGDGYGPLARTWSRKWYGEATFDPAETGSRPWLPDDPAVVTNIRNKMARESWGLADRLDVVGMRQQFYSTADPAEQERLEVIRMCGIWNRSWQNHLAEEDVQALRTAGLLARLLGEGDELLTAAEINEEVIRGRLGPMGWPGNAQDICVAARCERAGEPLECPTCAGEGEVWNSRAHKALYDAWQPIEPPAGEGWQMWETVSEGSPVTPVYATSEELIAALVADGYEESAATAFVHSGWAPSMVVTGRGQVLDGIAAAAYLVEGSGNHVN